MCNPLPSVSIRSDRRRQCITALWGCRQSRAHRMEQASGANGCANGVRGVTDMGEDVVEVFGRLFCNLPLHRGMLLQQIFERLLVVNSHRHSRTR